jgi:protease IV
MGRRVSRGVWANRWHRECCLCFAVVLTLLGTVARANPNEGEARSILRDSDRVYTVVAGEGDGASTVTNPANLGFLQAFNGVIDLAWTAQRALRRGSGAGAFVGIPLPFRIAALGLGYQFLYPGVPDRATAPALTPQPQNPDDPYSKVTFALAVPLERWVPGLSVGVNYSRLVASTNFHASGVNQVDLGIGWWPSRFVALGLVGRGLNVPRTGPPDAQLFQPLVIDPELAVRPLGTSALELAVGSRISPVMPGDRRFRTNVVDPRGRVFVTLGGVRVFAEAERFRFMPQDVAEDARIRDGVRIGAGVELAFPHVGVAAGAISSANAASEFGIDGGAARLRVSAERYDGFVVAPRRVTKLRMSDFRGDRGTWRLIQEIEQVTARRGVILVETQGMALGWAQVEEVREALLRHRLQGGKVFVYMDGGKLRQYFLAVVADRIMSHPTSSLSILGLRIQSLYYGDLLAKLGARAEFVRIAEYKSYPENFERDRATDASARQRELLYGDIWNHVLRMIARDRGHDPLVVKKWIDDAPYHPPRALRDGLVDDLAYPDEIDARLESWLGHRVRIEKPSKRRLHRDAYGAGARIAVLVIEGDLVDGKSFTVPLINRRVAGSFTLTEEIEKLRKDQNVRAVVVRIDSPGGSVNAAEAVARELDLLREVKPVVISMGNVCASGGYYIASSGQYIFADATTVTGSIGIFYPKVDISGTLAMFGIGIDEKNFGRRAGLRSWLKPYTDDEWAAALQDIQDGYAIFTGRVSAARSMTLARVDRVARGRIWSGVRGIDVGLVDDYGGIREAVLRARTIAELRPDEGEVVIHPEPVGRVENLRRMFSFDIPLPSGGGSDGDEPMLGRAGLGALVPPVILTVLRNLPTALWLAEAPEALALAEETILIEG